MRAEIIPARGWAVRVEACASLVFLTTVVNAPILLFDSGVRDSLAIWIAGQAVLVVLVCLLVGRSLRREMRRDAELRARRDRIRRTSERARRRRFGEPVVRASSTTASRHGAVRGIRDADWGLVISAEYGLGSQVYRG